MTESREVLDSIKTQREGEIERVVESGDETEDQVISYILSRPWWTRTWVIQEVAFAKRATLICGDDTLEWPSHQNVEASITNLRTNMLRLGQGTIKMKGLLEILQMQARRANPVKPSLVELVQLFERRLCTDMRDCVFALLSLALEHNALENSLDYSLSEEAVLSRLVQTSISQIQRLDILSCSEGPSIHHKGPSWRVGWDPDHKRNRLGFESSILPSTTLFRPYSAAGKSLPEATFLPKDSEPHLLALRGFIVDEISFVNRQRLPSNISSA